MKFIFKLNKCGVGTENVCQEERYEEIEDVWYSTGASFTLQIACLSELLSIYGCINYFFSEALCVSIESFNLKQYPIAICITFDGISSNE